MLLKWNNVKCTWQIYDIKAHRTGAYYKKICHIYKKKLLKLFTGVCKFDLQWHWKFLSSLWSRGTRYYTTDGGWHKKLYNCPCRKIMYGTCMACMAHAWAMYGQCLGLYGQGMGMHRHVWHMPGILYGLGKGMYGNMYEQCIAYIIPSTYCTCPYMCHRCTMHVIVPYTIWQTQARHVPYMCHTSCNTRHVPYMCHTCARRLPGINHTYNMLCMVLYPWLFSFPYMCQAVRNE